jgi:hypothetical protein
LLIAPISLTAQDWWLEGGPTMRGGMRVSISGSSYTQERGLHDPNATGPLTTAPGIGSATAYGNHQYGNGYVNADPGTGNPNSVGGPNTTWNWGYNNPSQYNSSAQTLTFQATGAPGYTATENHGVQGTATMLGGGVQLAVGRSVYRSGNWSVDICFGFEGIWAGTEKLKTSSYAEQVQRITTTDTYDVSGTGNLPSAPYSGTYLGPFGNPPQIPSPVIPNLPSRSQAISAPLSTSANAIEVQLQQSLYEFEAGPQISYQASEKLKAHLRPMLSLNVLNADVMRTEDYVTTPTGGASTTGAHFSDHSNSVGAQFGMALMGGLDVDLGRNCYFGASGGYQYVVKPFHVAIGPDTLTLDPSGWEIALVLGKHF